MPTAKVHLPFSTLILEFNLELDYVDMVNKYADEIQADKVRSKELDWSKNLVGNVVQEHAIESDFWLRCPDDEKDSLLDYMVSVGNHYFDQLYGKIPNEPYSYRGKAKKPEWKELMVNTSWIVNQVAGDFNPPHMHYGHLSCAGWLKVPDCITKGEERDEAGLFEFYHGSPQFTLDTKYPIKPEVGKFVMFPSWLQHTVYPFRGEGVRRSMAFNFLCKT
jgi:hypothetical protein|tara:strand:- start:378 stop:1034 length:657 start_codon:yes stop_codon:yes gene_type:complete